MQETERPKFALVIGAVFESFGQESTQARLMGYWIGLKDLPLEVLENAAGRALRECKSLPTIAELRRLAGELSAEDRAAAAWGDVLKAIPHGCYKHVDFQDKLCNAAIRMLGGWPTFVERFSSADSEKWARLDFLRVYQSLANSRVDGEACRPLAGLLEVQVRNRKLIAPVPVKIAADEARIGLPSSHRTAIDQRQAAKVPSLVLHKVEDL